MSDFKPVIKRHLSVPVLKFEIDKPRYLAITDKMHVGKAQKAKAGEKAKEPATLAACVNLETGEVGQIIVAAVIKGVFTDEYPNDFYVGKCFAITKLAPRPGKSYNQYTVAEIEDPRMQKPAAPVQPAAPAQPAAPVQPAFARGRRA
ncbi:MAG: hypothetical protein ACREQ5_07510 [Candidatus Dormibacteria bacterium]